jgi:hypothetical protein
MSKFNSIAFGSMTGSIGNVTTSKWRGINVARSKPTTVANPRSDGQVKQRIIFTALVALSRVFSTIFNIGFAKAAIKKTPYNVFVALNQASGLVTNPAGTPVYEVESLQLARGSANQITSLNTELDGDTVLVTINGINGSEPPVGSKMYFALITQNNTDAPVLQGFEEFPNITGTKEILSPNPLAGLKIFASVFYVNATTLQPCDSYTVEV